MSHKESDDDCIKPIEYLRQLVQRPRVASPDGSLNHDSLVYLASYYKGEQANHFFAIGAVGCSGSTPTQLLAVLDLLESIGTRVVASEFPAVVRQRLSFPVASLKEFPGRPREPSQDELDEFQRRLQADARRVRDEAKADEDLDAEIAGLLGIAIRPIANEWGWEREDTGERYSPSSDPTLAFELMEQFRLDVVHLVDDTRVGFAAGGKSTFFVLASECRHSVCRAIAVAAARRGKVEEPILRIRQPL